MSGIGKEIIHGSPVCLSDRLRHTYIIGQTGSGKTSLLRNLIAQDKSFGLLDPHGDLAEEILDLIPPNRTDDVIYFNPSDLPFPIGFNPLQNVEKDQQSLVGQGIIHSFKSVFGDLWGEGRMQYVFQNCLLALMETPDTTLLSVNRFLTDEVYRLNCVSRVTNPAVRHYWEVVFPRFKRADQALITSPVENKVGQFTTDPIVRNIFGQPKTKFSLKDIMDGQKIFIANLSKGRMGHINSSLMGSLLVSQFEVAAMSRIKNRSQFNLYLDEFQNFSTDSFEHMLSESRKYGLSLTLAHQYIDQLPVPLQRAVFGNVGTFICLRVGYRDAEYLGKEFNRPASQFAELSKYTAVVKNLINGEQTDSIVSLNPPAKVSYGRAENIKQQSRMRYGKDRQFVEKKIGEFYDIR